MAPKSASSIDSHDIITYQSAGKLLLAFLSQEFNRIRAASPEGFDWQAGDFVGAVVQRMLENDILRPSGDYMYESECKAKATRVALSIFHEATHGKKGDSLPLAETELLKRIDLYLKGVQEEKRLAREKAMRSKARTLSQDELAKYAPVMLSAQSAQAFNKEVENRAKRKV